MKVTANSCVFVTPRSLPGRARNAAVLAVREVVNHPGLPGAIKANPQVTQRYDLGMIPHPGLRNNASLRRERDRRKARRWGSG